MRLRSGNLISALNNVAVQIGDVTALNDLTIQDVQVVNVKDVLNNSNVLRDVHRIAATLIASMALGNEGNRHTG